MKGHHVSNEDLKKAMGASDSSISNEIELLNDELDEVAGGDCKSFTCGVYRVAE